MANKRIQITEDYYGGVDGIRSILNDYYEKELSQLEASEQGLARVFIEEGLILNKKRVLVSEGVEKERYHIEKDLLEKLLDSRIIRAENTHLGKSYELSHDALVGPIMKSFEKREAERKKKEEEEEKARQAELLAIETRKRRRITLLAIAGFALFFAATYFYVMANQATQEATRAKDKAENLATQLIVEQQKRDSTRFATLLERGIRALESGDYELAERELEEATTAKNNINKDEQSTLDSLIQVSMQRRLAKNSFEELILKARQEQAGNNFIPALLLVREANTKTSLSSEKEALNQLENELIQKLIPKFIGHVNNAQGLKEQGGNCFRAMEEITQAGKMKPFIPAAAISQYLQIYDKIKRDCS